MKNLLIGMLLLISSISYGQKNNTHLVWLQGHLINEKDSITIQIYEFNTIKNEWEYVAIFYDTGTYALSFNYEALTDIVFTNLKGNKETIRLIIAERGDIEIDLDFTDTNNIHLVYYDEELKSYESLYTNEKEYSDLTIPK